MEEGELYEPVADFPFLDVRQYEFVRNIERSKSCVYLYRRGQELLAVKEYKQVAIEDLPQRVQLLRRLLQLDHPNIVQYRGLARLTKRGRTDFSLLIFMNYYPKNLQEVLVERMHRRQYFTPEEVHSLLGQLLGALEKLQNMGIAHRDIKPQNVLVEEGNYRLCDFEDSLEVDSHEGDFLNVTTIEYSPLAMLAELKSLHQSAFDPFKADVYALGLTMLVVCSLGRFLPVERINYAANSKDHRFFIKQNRKRFVKKRYPSYINRTLKLMLEDDEFKREDFVTLRMKLEQLHDRGLSSEYSKSETTSASGSTRKSTNITDRRPQSKGVQVHRPLLLALGLLLVALILLCIY